MADQKMERNLRESRPRLSLNPYHGQVHEARVLAYGADKYAEGNFQGAPPAGVDPVQRIQDYVDAAARHLGKISQAISHARGTGGDLRAACAVVDDEASAGFPASMLPHLSHALAGLAIAVECAANDGLLAKDPGEPWRRDPAYAAVLARRGEGPKGLVQKDDPDAELARIRSTTAPPISPQPFDFAKAATIVEDTTGTFAKDVLLQAAAAAGFPVTTVGEREHTAAQAFAHRQLIRARNEYVPVEYLPVQLVVAMPANTEAGR
jgi:hypothetical protein